ncbi:hypothetical protein [Endozoicomonas sp. ISHI1]|uniref:hypothetical protein n=1 Tax=Endozoicomonas sp. ISHI1 TaxID=2825882 RepID=UPI0021491D45|nr:hypothetical protein [Endozoicomonas sp. ISHI1]
MQIIELNSLHNSAIDLNPLEKEIKNRKLVELWQSENDPSGKKTKSVVKEKVFKAIRKYIRLTESTLNDGSNGFKELAAVAALDLYEFISDPYYSRYRKVRNTRRKYTVQAIGREHWKSWGKLD